MMKTIVNRVLKLFPIICLSLAACSTAPPATPDAEESAIRAVREASNTALAAHDSAGLSRTLTPDYVVVTSRNAVNVEQQTMVERLAADWLLKPDLIYVRTPGRIDVNADWRMAGETGTWVGTWTEPEGDKIQLEGTYYAKWHKIEGRWYIRAEIFTPLTCRGGSFCDQSPI